MLGLSYVDSCLNFLKKAHRDKQCPRIEGDPKNRFVLIHFRGQKCKNFPFQTVEKELEFN